MMKQYLSNKLVSFLCSLLLIMSCMSCGVYSFRNTSIPENIKTIKISIIENRARIVNPQLSPKLTEKLQQKVANQTRLIRTNNDDAHYQVSGTITDYSVSTAAITSTTAATNRLTVSIHMILKNLPDNKTQEFDISRNFDFSANLSFQQAETKLMDEIVQGITDEIFNHLFSNW